MLTLLALVLSTAPATQAADPVRPTRSRPLLAEDALYVIPDVAWQLQGVGDVDGDGLDDLVVQRGGVFWGRGLLAGWTSLTGWGHPRTPARIEAVSARDGAPIRTLWTCDEQEVVSWDAGGDVDGDGVPDLLVGRAGSVLIVSGASGQVLREAVDDDDNPYPRPVAFAGDQDCDGRDDYAFGAPGGPEHVGRVSLCSGADGGLLWTLEGDAAGDGFGLCLSALGDVDGDGFPDLAVASVPGTERPLLVVSGSTGEVLARIEDGGGPFGPAGDLDGDGRADLFLGSLVEDSSDVSCTVEVLHPGREVPLAELWLPDRPFGSSYSRVVPLGDVDGDGVADFLLGNANFHVGGEGPDSPPSHAGIPAPDLRAMTLAASLAIDSDPWCAFTWHSGTAWVRSGRTREVLLSAWGPPGSRQGMGLAGCSIPDLDGDGWPEVAVVDMDGAYVFPGPGPHPDPVRDEW